MESASWQRPLYGFEISQNQAKMPLKSRFSDGLGGGMILILGLHGILMSILSLFYDFQGLIKYLEPVLIILIMVPVIIFVKKYVPVLYGYKRL